MTNLTTLFGGAAIFTTIGLVWNNIKFLFSRISSLFIVTVRINGHIPKAMEVYLVKNFRRSPFQPLAFSTFRDYVKIIKKRHIIGYEEVNFKDKTIFWKKWSPLIVSMSNNKSGGMEKPQEVNESSASISFFRGTFNIDKLIIEALELLNERSVKNDKISRFTIYRHFGRSSKEGRLDESPAGYAKVQESSGNADVFLGDKRILKYRVDDIGEDQDDKRSLGVLAFPKEIDALVDEIERWKNSEDWYRKKSITWKRGWCLFGGPGCVLPSTKIKIRKKFNVGRHKKIIVH